MSLGGKTGMSRDDGTALSGVPEDLWRRVEGANHRLLMLDYDGTLAPFRADRGRAVPHPRSLELVREISESRHTSVAIVSGRPLAEVERLAGPLRAIFVGEHGWERRAADGSVARCELDPRVSKALAQAEEAARKAGGGELIERKRTGVVLHTRRLPREEARILEDRYAGEWARFAHDLPLSVDRIDGGIELRARGRDKGTIVRELLGGSPPGTLGVFVGDDVTDEDAFAAVAGRGFGVRVGTSPRPSGAAASLPSCEAVADFLAEWLRVAEGRETRRADPR
jgi:trehalose 6-phosphate phosphatase